MPPRLRYPDLAPGGYAALSAFGHYINTATALDPVLLGLVNLRASILNGCNFCIDMHTHELRRLHEPESRIEAVRNAPQSSAFTLREQAALRWTEVITRLDSSHASDQDYAAITQFFRDKELVDLTFAIANINAWNRMGIAFRPEWHEHTGSSAAAVPASISAPSPTTGEGAEPESIPATDDDGGKVAQD